MSETERESKAEADAKARGLGLWFNPEGRLRLYERGLPLTDWTTIDGVEACLEGIPLPVPQTQPDLFTVAAAG